MSGGGAAARSTPAATQDGTTDGLGAAGGAPGPEQPSQAAGDTTERHRQRDRPTKSQLSQQHKEAHAARLAKEQEVMDDLIEKQRVELAEMKERHKRERTQLRAYLKAMPDV